MKYYAVTEDPRELYHYGVKGMKWGQHIFGDKPKSPGYHKAVKKLKSLSEKASKATAKSISTVGQTVKKSAQQMLYNARAAQQKRFNKAVERSQKRYDKIDQKIENYYANKPVKDAKKQAAVNSIKQGASAVASFIRETPGQIAYTARKHEENRYQKAVQKAQDRNKLSDALRGLDKEEKLIKQVDRDRKMEELREKHADIMADNDLKAMQKAVRVEKSMPRYYQEARTGQLKYGKLSDEQISRLQNRLALEANTRRLGSTEEPSWREQKKQARRQGYLQGITRGTSAAMEEVGRASVQFGVHAINRAKLKSQAKHEGERQKAKDTAKNKKTRKDFEREMEEEVMRAEVRDPNSYDNRKLKVALVGKSRAQQNAEKLKLIEAKRDQKNLENDRKKLNDEIYRNIMLGNKNMSLEDRKKLIAQRDEIYEKVYGKKPELNIYDSSGSDNNGFIARQVGKAKSAAKNKANEIIEGAKDSAKTKTSEMIESAKTRAQKAKEEKERNARAQERLNQRVENQKRIEKVAAAHDRVETYKRLRQKQRILAMDPTATREQIEDNNDAINAILADIAKERLRKQKAGLK